MNRVRHWFAPALVLVAVAVASGSIAAGVSTRGTAEVPASDAPSIRPGHVVGVVKSANADADLRGVAVVLVRDQHVVDRTVTNRDGKFTLPNIRPGRFVIAAEKRGVGAGREAANVKPGETARVQIELKKPA
ncbi:MAG: carboxypeptidase regulatory-like domain-containing protein [Phycisphaeraceae bacterium]|nr:carboxypeptidase regulatory-like domain-containing protein [Phycisphaeraceae bacterium]